MKHTPGPWKVFKRGPCGPAVESFWIGKESQYPEWRGPEHMGDLCSHSLFNGTSNEREAEGNAQLIAAAPDMLDALECARLLLFGPTSERSKADAIKTIEQAIAKAKGTK